MGNIIYKSENIIPWDTQSAFKMTNYNVSVEENMIFCYLKAYVHRGDLVLCSYCFTEHPHGTDNIHLYINLKPENKDDVLKIDFGFEGVQGISFKGQPVADSQMIEYRTFKTDDEQGFYWCGELVIKADAVKQLAGTCLEENSIFTLNMTQTFENGDFSVLFGNPQLPDYNPAENMNVFLVLDY